MPTRDSTGGNPKMPFGDDARARFNGQNYVSDEPQSGGGVRISVQCRPNSAARGQAMAGDDLRPERQVRSRPSSHEDMEAREKQYPQNGRGNAKGRG